MSSIAKHLTELIGNTPLLELNKFSEAKGIVTPVIAKVEFSDSCTQGQGVDKHTHGVADVQVGASA